MIRSTAAASALAVLALGVACGGGSNPASAPTPTPPPAGVPAGTVWSVASAASAEPIGGARVVVGGRSYGTDAGGQVTLAEPAPFGSSVDILADGFLDRQTLVRRSGPSRFTLWPRTSPLWPSESYTQKLVYTAGTLNPPAAGTSALQRIRRGSPQVGLVLSQAIWDDAEARYWHDRAANQLNVAVAGRVVYSATNQRPAGGVAIEVREDFADSYCTQNNILAYTQVTLEAGEVNGGKIVYCRPGVTRSGTVGHEVGHTFGLQHSAVSTDLMFPSSVRARSWDLQPGEVLVMNLMLERPGGNRYPDNDREVSSAARARETIIYLCP